MQILMVKSSDFIFIKFGHLFRLMQKKMTTNISLVATMLASALKRAICY